MTEAYVPDVAACLAALEAAEAEQGEMLLDGTAYPWWEDRSEEGRAALCLITDSTIPRARKAAAVAEDSSLPSLVPSSSSGAGAVLPRRPALWPGP